MGLLLLALASCASPTGAKQLFVIAGQSNAEGYAMLDGLKKLVAALPQSGDGTELPHSVRDAARRAIAEAQGLECESTWSTTSTADKTIDELRTSAVDWRAFADASYSHPTVKIHAAHYTHAKVMLQNRQDGSVLDNEKCMAVSSEATRYGPLLSRYNVSHSANAFMPLAPGFGGHSPLAAAHGLEEHMLTYGTELAFGAELANAFPDTILLKVAMGHSTLGDHWRTDGPLYARLLQHTIDALQSQQASFGGLVWFQGFSDQWKDVWCQNLSAQYEDNLRTFLRRFRADLGVEVPVVVVQARNGGKFQYTDAPHLRAIQQAQEAVSASLPKVSLVQSADLSDCFHYDAGSQVVIGERAAKAMLELLKGPITTPLTSITATSTEHTSSAALTTTRVAHVSEPALKLAQTLLFAPAPSAESSTTSTIATTSAAVGVPSPEPTARPAGAAEVPGILAEGAIKFQRRVVRGTMTLQVRGAAKVFEQDVAVKPMLEQSIAAMAGVAKKEVTVVLGARHLSSHGLRGWSHSLGRSLAASNQVFVQFEVEAADEKMSAGKIRAVFASIDVKSANAVLALHLQEAGRSKYRATVVDVTVAEARVAEAEIATTSNIATTKYEQWRDELSCSGRLGIAWAVSLVGFAWACM